MRLFVLLAVLGSITLWAGTNEWTSLGPEGGPIRILAVHPVNPSTVYAASDGASFKTTNAGLDWKVTNFPVGLVVNHPQDGDTLYVATQGKGIFRSIDAGATWAAVNSGLPYKSFVFSLLINPQNPSTLYASVSWNGPLQTAIFKTVDGGESWNAANSGLPQGESCCEFLAMDSRDPDTLYNAISDLDTVGGGLYKSTDGAVSWARVEAMDAIASAVNRVVVDPENPSTLYAYACKGSGDNCFSTILKSVDRGASWSTANSGLPDRGFLGFPVIDPQNAGVLYLAGDAGLFKTADGAENWTAVNRDLKASTLVIDSHNAGTLYAGAADGVLKSTDGGSSWNLLHSGLTATNIHTLEIDPQNPNTLYTVSWAEGPGAVLKTTDGGSTWIALTTPAGVTSLIVDPQNTATVYAISPANRFPVGPPGGMNGGLFKSEDGGASWKEVSSGLPTFPFSLALDPSSPDTAYASTGSGIFKTTDGAASWRSLGPGLTATGLGPFGAGTLAVDPKNSNTIYAFWGGIWKSTDGGVNFSRSANSGLPANPHSGSILVDLLAIDPQTFSTLYAWTSRYEFGDAVVEGGLFRSANAGADWEMLSPGPPGITSLAIDPRSVGTLYAGTPNGVLKSTDRGSNWSFVTSGLSTHFVNTLAIDPQTGAVYAGTSGGGVFAITFAP